MSEFIVHTFPGSPYARAVLTTLEEKGASYRLSPLAPGSFRIEPHILRHPFGKMPVIDHGDFRLYETQAILRYLDRVLPEPALTPTDARRAARMDQLMNINDCYLFRGVADVIVFHRVVAPAVLGLAPDEAAIAAAMPQAEVVFAELSRLLGDQAFFTGDELSLADLHIAPQLDLFSRAPEWSVLTASRPNLAAWLDRMEARPSLAKTTWAKVAELAQAA